MEITLTGICGSPRKASTAYVIREALKAAEEVPGVKTQLIELRGKKINPCIHCNACRKQDEPGCPTFDDDMAEILPLWSQSDAYLIASPVYSMNITGPPGLLSQPVAPLGL